MSLRFVLGRAGMGKTQYFIEKIKEKLMDDPKGPPIILLVPEQATFQMEQAILEEEGIKGFTRLHILSFERLSKRVLENAGGDNKTYLTDTGKEMILKKLVRERINEGKVQFLKKAAGQRSFSNKLSNFIREAKMYHISPDDLLPDDTSPDDTSSVDMSLEDEKSKSEVEISGEIKRVGEKKNSLEKKLEEVYLLYKDYQDFIGGEYQHKEDYYFKAYERMEDFELLRNSEVYVDGFFGFTPRELIILEKILTISQGVEISLTLDPQWIENNLSYNETDLFYPLLETYNKISQRAKLNNIEILEPIHLIPEKDSCRFKESRELYLLENNFDKVSPGEAYTDTPRNIELIQASNRRAEVEKLARKIISEVRDRDRRYNDISIIVRDFEDYEPLIKSIFSKYNIPYFIDRKEQIHHHPLVELIRSALEILIYGWPYESVFRFLKTDLIDIERDQVDKLENYVLAHGISGEKWLENDPWEYLIEEDFENLDKPLSKKQEKYLEEINEIREKAVSPLRDTYEKLIKKNKDDKNKAGIGEVPDRESDNRGLTVYEITRQLWEFIERVEAPARLESWIENNKNARHQLEEQLHTQVWENLVELFEQLVSYMGDKEIKLNEYLEVVEAGLENISLGLIPPSVDQVIVGTVERSRQHDIKSVFVLGMCEGSFPAVYLESGLFNDRERRFLRDRGIELAPTTQRRLYDESFWSYIALTRAKEKLYISYPLVDQDDSVLQPSHLMDDIKRIFPALEEEYFHEDLLEETYDWLIEPNNTIPIVIQYIRDIGKNKGGQLSYFWQELLELLKEEYPTEYEENPSVKGYYYRNRVDVLPDDFLKDYYEGVLKTSVSALESFASCRFKFFGEKVLNLKEREIFRLDPLGFGLLYHAVLKLFFERLKEKKLSWKDIDVSEIDSYLESIMAELRESMKTRIFESSARNEFVTKKLKEHLNNAINILKEYEEEGDFLPLYAELTFGERGELSPLEENIAGDKKLRLEGKIDRVDEGRVGEKEYIRVIDYKGSSKPLELKELYHGINLQLAAYLLVVLDYFWSQGRDVYPAGMLYFGVKNPLISTESPLSDNKARMEFNKEMRMEGYILADKDVYLAMAGGREDLLRQKYSDKQGRFTSNSRVLDPEEFQRILDFVRTKIGELGEEISKGEFSPYPYREGKKTACGLCPYHPVCQFDSRFEDNAYRFLGRGNRKDFLDRMMSRQQNDEDW